MKPLNLTDFLHPKNWTAVELKNCECVWLNAQWKSLWFAEPLLELFQGQITWHVFVQIANTNTE